MKLLWLAASFAASPSPWRDTAELLQALDSRDIRYPPTATRVELEALWSSAAARDADAGHCQEATASSVSWLPEREIKQQQQPASKRPDWSDLDIAERQHRRRRRQRRLQRSSGPSSPSSSFLTQRIGIHLPSYATALKATAGGILNQGYRKVRRVKRDIVEAWEEAEDGVRTVPYEYVHQEERERGDDLWNTNSRRGSSPRNKRKEDSRSSSSRPTKRRTSGGVKDGKRRRSYQYHQQARPMLLLPPVGGTAASSQWAKHQQQQQQQPPDRPTTSSGPFQTPRATKRKIYSPYNDPTTTIKNDLLDEIGNFFVEAADRTLWNNDQRSNNKQRQPPPPKHNKKKHWKDVWEERVDSMLGIHEDVDTDDDPYRRWSDGPDPVVPPLQKRPRRRRYQDSTDESYWGRGSILSLILSRHEPRLYPWDRVDALWESSGSVLTLLRWCVRTCARWYGKICRWAAYDNTLPQAAVVTFVTAIFLSAAPKRRLGMVAIALVTIRAIGEAVRGKNDVTWNGDDEDDESPEDYNAADETHWYK